MARNGRGRALKLKAEQILMLVIAITKILTERGLKVLFAGFHIPIL